MTGIKKLITSFLAMILIAAAFAGSALAFEAEVYSNTMKVYSRTTASSKYVIGSLAKGTEFDIVAYSGNWAKIEYRGRTGYASISDIMSHSKKTMYVKSSANVYQKPSSSSKKLGILSINTVVYMVGWSGDYYLVMNQSGSTGYMLKSSLSSSYVQRTGYTNDTVTVYKTASTSKVLGKVSVNTKLTVIGESGNYYKVKNSSGSVGYVKKGTLSASKVSVRKDPAYTNRSTPVYKRASSSSGKIGTLSVNTLVYVTGETGSYYKVLNAAGTQTGYILKSNLSQGKTNVSSNSNSSLKGTYQSSTSTTTMPVSLKSTQSTASKSLSNAKKLEYVIYYAQERLGYRYSTSPNNVTSYDCLTLLYYGFSKVGVSIPSSAYKCGYTGSYKTITNPSQLKRGDIVCFNTNKGDSDLSDHVGIYLGNNRFIHASSGAGMVIVSRMDSGFYRENFFCGRRILN